MQIVVIAGMVAYLACQSVSDIRTMKVYTLPNNVVLLLMTVMYAFQCAAMHTLPNLESVVLAIALFALSKTGLFGIGDAKAMLSMYLSFSVLSSSTPHPSMFAFLITVLASNVLFLICNWIKGFATKTKVKRAAYYPFLLVGYVFGIVGQATGVLQ